MTEPSQQQINNKLDKLEEEHHAIIFIYKTNRQKYGKFLEKMENDLLQRKDPFPKTVVDAWKNRYSTREYKRMDANDAMASEEENDKKIKKKEIMCYKCKKTRHYAIECDE